jgi:hypothetical protein
MTTTRFEDPNLLINYTTRVMTFGVGRFATRVKVIEVGKTFTGAARETQTSTTYEIRMAKSGSLEGYLTRRYSYNAHTDWAQRTLDRPRVLLGDNLSLEDAVERTLCID